VHHEKTIETCKELLLPKNEPGRKKLKKPLNRQFI